MRIVYIRLLFALLATAPATFPIAGRADSGTPDAFGYSCTSATALYQWIEPESPTDMSNGGEIIQLQSPIAIYGGSPATLGAFRAGFLSPAVVGTSADVTPDCPLPAAASEGRGHRIYVNHFDLTDPAGSSIQFEHKYHARSPHPHHVGGVHIFTWLNCVRRGQPTDTPFSFQVLMFDNTDILMQFPTGNASINDATHGIQNDAASNGLSAGAAGIDYGCNDPGAFAGAARAVLFSLPVRQVTTNVDIVASDGQWSLREAVNSLVNGGRIVFAPALSGQTITLGSDLDINEAISIDASALPSRVKITDSGTSGNRIETTSYLHVQGIEFRDMGTAITANAPLVVSDARFRDNAGSACIGSTEGLSVTHSTFTGNSGGCISAATIDTEGFYRLLIEGCTFSSNDDGDHGGCISVVGGTVRGHSLTINDSTFFSNSSDGCGGAIASVFGGTIQANVCDFRSNRARGQDLGDYLASERGGGAIFVDDAPCDINACHFSANESDVAGAGGVHSLAGNTTIDDSTFDSNEGGAIEIRSGNSNVIRNSTIANNTGSYAIVVKEDVGLSLLHSTIAGNDSPSIGSALAVGTGSEVEFGHNLFADNDGLPGQPFVVTGPDVVIKSLGYNTADTPSPQLVGTGDAPSEDPGLLPLDDYGGPFPTMALAPGSPALDSGDPNVSSPPATDGRGAPRISPGRPIDRGAFENQERIEVTTAADENLNPGTGISYREAVSWISDGGTITFHPSLDGETIPIGFPAIGPTPAKCTIDASNLPNKITLEETSGVEPRLLRSPGGGRLTVEGVIFANSYPEASGDSEFTDCEFRGAGFGLVAKGDLDLRDSLVRQLVVIDSGGTKASADITGCDFLDIDGEGAIYIEADPSSLTIEDTVIDGTEINSGGSAVVSVRGKVVITDSSITNTTTTGRGAALNISDGDLILTNSTISGNHADDAGGAMYIDNSATSIFHCTIVQNSSGNGAGGLHFNGVGRTTIGHSIVANNQMIGVGSDNFSGNPPGSFGFNLIDTTGEIGARGGDLIGVQPLLGPLSYYGSASGRRIPVHAPFAISPTIDAGSPGISNPPSGDGRGFSRIADGSGDGTAIIDIGAVEASKPIIVQHNGPSQFPGSLGSAIATTPAGGRILFDADLDGETIASGNLLEPINSVQIDATSLPRGITISGANTHGGLAISSGRQVAMHAVSITDCRVIQSGGNVGYGAGVGVSDQSTLTFTHATIYNCEAAGLSAGGALAGRSGAHLLVYNATLSGNSAGSGGSGIYLEGETTHLDLIHSAVVANTSPSGIAPVAGIDLTSASCRSYSSIVTRNERNGSPSNFGGDPPGRFESMGFLLTDTQSSPAWSGIPGPDDLVGRVASEIVESGLSDLGGWSLVHQPPQSGSGEGIDAGGQLARFLPTFDQIGFSRQADGGSGSPRIDIGPFEFKGEFHDTDGGGIPDWWENLYHFNPNDAADAIGNPDGDAYNNLEEFDAGTHPRIPDVLSAVPVILSITHSSGGTVVMTFAGPPGQDYQLQESGDLDDWSTNDSGTFHGLIQAVRFATSEAREFYRLVEP